MSIQNYPPEIESPMRSFYTRLSEKDRRRYAAIEVTTLGYAGTADISELLQCDEQTIRRGQRDFNVELSNETKRVRQNGAGRQQVLSTIPALDDVLLETLNNNSAGSPIDETIKWTTLSRSAIAETLEEQGFKVSVTVVDKLLKKHHFRRRQAFKVEAGKKNILQREEQFKNIEALKLQSIAQGTPVLSMDVKKKS